MTFHSLTVAGVERLTADSAAVTSRFPPTCVMPTPSGRASR